MSDIAGIIRALVNEQAEDEGLWFIAETAPEAYLQQELRRLHAVIEAAPPPLDGLFCPLYAAGDGTAAYPPTRCGLFRGHRPAHVWVPDSEFRAALVQQETDQAAPPPLDELREALRDFMALMPPERWALLRPATHATIDALAQEEADHE